MKLTDKQTLFVHEYLIDRNATQAAIRAGYKAKTAQEQSNRLLSNVKVKAAIDNALPKRIERKVVDVLHDIQDLVRTAKTEYLINPSNASMLNAVLNALQLEGKHLGVMEKLDLNGEKTCTNHIFVETANLTNKHPEAKLNEQGIKLKFLTHYDKTGISYTANQVQHEKKWALYDKIKPLWRNYKNEVNAGIKIRNDEKFAKDVLNSPLNDGPNGSRIMCGINSWRTIIEKMKAWEATW